MLKIFTTIRVRYAAFTDEPNQERRRYSLHLCPGRARFFLPFVLARLSLSSGSICTRARDRAQPRTLAPTCGPCCRHQPAATVLSHHCRSLRCGIQAISVCDPPSREKPAGFRPVWLRSCGELGHLGDERRLVLPCWANDWTFRLRETSYRDAGRILQVRSSSGHR